jgi:hypothetical protein
MPPNDIQPVLPPWKLKGTVYMFPFWTKASDIAEAGKAGITYSPLEAKSAFASSEDSGKHLGGLSMVQIIRYTKSPVGPYDELILAPGSHEYVVEENGRRVKKRNLRITRIYVSQKYTCWNGRKSECNTLFFFSSESEHEMADAVGRLEYPEASRVL